MLNMQNYQACLEDEANEERARAGDENKSQLQARENRLISKHNAASDEMTRTSESFKKAVVDSSREVAAKAAPTTAPTTETGQSRSYLKKSLMTA